MATTITEINTSKQLNEFIAFQRQLYKGNDCYVPPLDSREKAFFNRNNPMAENCEFKLWIAKNDKKTVGRIAGIINHNYNKEKSLKQARFSHFDSINNTSIAQQLLATAEDWAKSKGMTSVIGPFGFTNLDKHGILVEGFNILSCQSSNYNYPYYQELIESYGYTKEVDWVERTVIVPEEEPPKIKQFSEIISKRYSLKKADLSNKKRIEELAPKIFDVYNDAYADLYGVSTLNERQKEHLIKSFIPMVNPDLVCVVVDKDDNIVGFSITIMSLSRSLQKANGRLFPFGFIHLMNNKKNNCIIDTALLGVHHDYQRKGVNAMLFHELNKGVKKHNVNRMETTQSLESNQSIRNILNTYFEMDENRRARLYIKSLA